MKGVCRMWKRLFGLQHGSSGAPVEAHVLVVARDDEDFVAPWQRSNEHGREVRVERGGVREGRLEHSVIVLRPSMRWVCGVGAAAGVFRWVALRICPCTLVRPPPIAIPVGSVRELTCGRTGPTFARTLKFNEKEADPLLDRTTRSIRFDPSLARSQGGGDAWGLVKDIMEYEEKMQEEKKRGEGGKAKVGVSEMGDASGAQGSLLHFLGIPPTKRLGLCGAPATTPWGCGSDTWMHPKHTIQWGEAHIQFVSVRAARHFTRALRWAHRDERAIQDRLVKLNEVEGGREEKVEEEVEEEGGEERREEVGGGGEERQGVATAEYSAKLPLPPLVIRRGEAAHMVFDAEKGVLPGGMGLSGLAYRIQGSFVFETTVLLFIMLNVVVLATGRDEGITDEARESYRVLELLCSIVFTIEALVKIVALEGFTPYVNDAWNTFDFLLVAAGWISEVASITSTSTSSTSNIQFTAFRAFRALRVLRTLRFAQGLRDVVDTFGATVPLVGRALLVFAWSVLMFAVLGVDLFSTSNSQFCTLPQAGIRPTPISNPYTSLFTHGPAHPNNLSSWNPDDASPVLLSAGLFQPNPDAWSTVGDALNSSHLNPSTLPISFSAPLPDDSFNSIQSIPLQNCPNPTSTNLAANGTRYSPVKNLLRSALATLSLTSSITPDDLGWPDDASNPYSPFQPASDAFDGRVGGENDACPKGTVCTFIDQGDSYKGFHTLGAALMTIWRLSARAPGSTAYFRGTLEGSTPFATLYFLGVICLVSFLVLSLFVAIVRGSFVEVTRKRKAMRAALQRLDSSTGGGRGMGLEGGIAQAAESFRVIVRHSSRYTASMFESRRRIAPAAASSPTQQFGEIADKRGSAHSDMSSLGSNSGSMGDVGGKEKGAGGARSAAKLAPGTGVSASTETTGTDVPWYERPTGLVCCMCPKESMIPQTTKKIISHPDFDVFIILMIVANTIALAMEHYGASREYRAGLAVAELVFSFIFTVEMFLKIVGLGGVYHYCIAPGTGWNRFDCIVVISSLVDITLSFVNGTSDINLLIPGAVATDGSSGINLSLLRIFRLVRVLRVLRVLRANDDLRKLLYAITSSGPDLGALLAFLVVVILSFAVLGIQLFGGRLGSPPPRAHFDDLGSAMLTLYRMLAGGGTWGIFDTMLAPARGEDGSLEDMGYFLTVSLYFFLYTTFSSLVTLNFLVVIILSRLALTPAERAKKLRERAKMQFSDASNRRKLAILDISAALERRTKDEAAFSSEESRAFQSMEVRAGGEGSGEGGGGRREVATEPDAPPLGRLESDDAGAYIDAEAEAEAVMDDEIAAGNMSEDDRPEGSSSTPSSSRRDMQSAHSTPRALPTTPHRQIAPAPPKAESHSSESEVTKHDDGEEDGGHEHGHAVGIRVPAADTLHASRESDEVVGTTKGELGDDDGVEVGDDGSGASSHSLHAAKTQTPKPDTIDDMTKDKEGVAEDSTPAPTSIRRIDTAADRGPAPLLIPRATSKLGEEEEEKGGCFAALGALVYGTIVGAGAQCSSFVDRTCPDQGRSLCMFPRSSPIRQFSRHLVRHPTFEKFILVCIILSSATLAFDAPSLRKSSDEFVVTLFVLDVIFIAIFSFEAILKIIAMGFWVGKRAYLKDSWNVLDFIVVILSLGSLVGGLGAIVRVGRLGRVLRPLRAIRRNPGMRVVINALLRSLPAVMYVVLLLLFFFFVFGVLAVNLFAGMLWRCSDAAASGAEDCIGAFALPSSALSTALPTEQAWLLSPRTWAKYSGFGFDSVPVAMQTLFEVATLRAWPPVLLAMIDATGVQTQPQRDANPAAALFLVIFIFLGAFYMMKLFVGIIVGYYRQFSGTALLSERQQEWAVLRRVVVFARPKPGPPKEGWRFAVYQIVIGPYRRRYELLEIALLTIHLVCVGILGSNPADEDGLYATHWIMTGLYILHASLRPVALGFCGYYESEPFWFVYDIISFLAMLVIPAVTGPGGQRGVGLLRTIRFSRLPRLLGNDRGLAMLLGVIEAALPAMGNVTALLGLLGFVFAVLGVQLFATTRDGVLLGPRASFVDFPNAFWTLVQILAGENWVQMMRDGAVAPPACIPGDTGWDGDCGYPGLSQLYFFMFYIMTFAIFLNLYVASILDAYVVFKAGRRAIIEGELQASTGTKDVDGRELHRTDFPPLKQVELLDDALDDLGARPGQPPSVLGPSVDEDVAGQEAVRMAEDAAGGDGITSSSSEDAGDEDEEGSGAGFSFNSKSGMSDGGSARKIRWPVRSREGKDVILVGKGRNGGTGKRPKKLRRHSDDMGSGFIEAETIADPQGLDRMLETVEEDEESGEGGAEGGGEGSGTVVKAPRKLPSLRQSLAKVRTRRAQRLYRARDARGAGSFLRPEDVASFRIIWAHYDPRGTARIPAMKLPALLRSLWVTGNPLLEEPTGGWAKVHTKREKGGVLGPNHARTKTRKQRSSWQLPALSPLRLRYMCAAILFEDFDSFLASLEGPPKSESSSASPATNATQSAAPSDTGGGVSSSTHPPAPAGGATTLVRTLSTRFAEAASGVQKAKPDAITAAGSLPSEAIAVILSAGGKGATTHSRVSSLRRKRSRRDVIVESVSKGNCTCCNWNASGEDGDDADTYTVRFVTVLRVLSEIRAGDDLLEPFERRLRRAVHERDLAIAVVLQIQDWYRAKHAKSRTPLP